eukprot:tig00021222_g19363.t1
MAASSLHVTTGFLSAAGAAGAQLVRRPPARAAEVCSLDDAGAEEISFEPAKDRVAVGNVSAELRASLSDAQIVKIPTWEVSRFFAKPTLLDNCRFISVPHAFSVGTIGISEAEALQAWQIVCKLGGSPAAGPNPGPNWRGIMGFSMGPNNITRFINRLIHRLGGARSGGSPDLDDSVGYDLTAVKRKIHVAWLGKKSPFCGNVTYGNEVTGHLKKRGYRVSMYHFSQEAKNGQEGDNINITDRLRRAAAGQLPGLKQNAFVAAKKDGVFEVSLPCVYKGQVYTIPTPSSTTVFSNSLQSLKPDIVHASLTLSPLDFFLPEICAELGVPLVATFHPPFSAKRKSITQNAQHLVYKLYAPFLANYDRVIIFSEMQRDVLAQLGVPVRKIAVIPNGVDPDKYCPGKSNLRRELGNPESIYVYMGRIAPEKNVEAMLQGWVAANMGPKAKLVVVGAGPLMQGLQQTYGEKQGVVWKGFISDEATRIEILRGADVFILPSLVEGLSLSLLEAMATGCACVATDAGADGEVIAGGAGIVMDTMKDVAQQLEVILPVLRDQPELRRAMGQKARQRVLEKYTLRDNIDRVEALYATVLKERAAQADAGTTALRRTGPLPWFSRLLAPSKEPALAARAGV